MLQTDLQTATAKVASILLFALVVVLAHSAQAQTFTVIHNFTGGADGANPYAGVTVGPSGVLYGTASAGGTGQAGTVFKLARVGSSWTLNPLYEFTAASGGALPLGGVVIGPNGALYGTTQSGGYMGRDCNGGCGVVYELRPPLTVCKAVLCYWNETVLYVFMGTPDGEYPQIENLAFDQPGDIYGTTADGGIYSGGTTFELTPSGGGYTESILHNFGSGTDGADPTSGVVLDASGNVYGTTDNGGTGTECAFNCGTVYQLMPSSGGWVENVLVNFDDANGYYPLGNLIIDASGNLYGTTRDGGEGENDGGVVYKLAPSGGGFTYSGLYTFISSCESTGVAMDADGNFFGVCQAGGAHQDGWVLELTNCSETCAVVDLHDFIGSDGSYPLGSPVLDANGNLYGTTLGGGTGNCNGGCGVVWEIEYREKPAFLTYFGSNGVEFLCN